MEGEPRTSPRHPPRAGEPSDPAPPAAPSPVALPGKAPGGGDERRGDTGTRTPVRSRSPAASSAGPGAGKVTGGGGGREGAGPRRGYFERRQPAQRVPFPFLGLGLAGQVTGAASPSLPRAPSPPRDAAGAAGGGGKGAVKVPCWVRVARSAGAVLGREGSPGASAAAPALPWGVRYGVIALGEGSRSAAGLCLGARCASVLGCPQRGVTLGTGAAGPLPPQAPAAGERHEPCYVAG